MVYSSPKGSQKVKNCLISDKTQLWLDKNPDYDIIGMYVVRNMENRTDTAQC